MSLLYSPYASSSQIILNILPQTWKVMRCQQILGLVDFVPNAQIKECLCTQSLTSSHPGKDGEISYIYTMNNQMTKNDYRVIL